MSESRILHALKQPLKQWTKIAADKKDFKSTDRGYHKDILQLNWLSLYIFHIHFSRTSYKQQFLALVEQFLRQPMLHMNDAQFERARQSGAIWQGLNSRKETVQLWF